MTLTYSEVDILAREHVGNWKHFSDFGWHGQPDDSDQWCIVYTENRDSRLSEQSNAEKIDEMLQRFIDRDNPDVIREHHGHWACGWVDGYAVRVYRNGNVTRAFRVWCDIVTQLESYPLLDEEDYSRREYEATIENLTNEGYDADEYDAPDGWEDEVYGWLWDNNPGAIENTDDQGGYASRSDIHDAMDALGWRIVWVVRWIDCGPDNLVFYDEWEAIDYCAELQRKGLYPKLSEEREGE